MCLMLKQGRESRVARDAVTPLKQVRLVVANETCTYVYFSKAQGSTKMDEYPSINWRGGVPLGFGRGSISHGPHSGACHWSVFGQPSPHCPSRSPEGHNVLEMDIQTCPPVRNKLPSPCPPPEPLHTLWALGIRTEMMPTVPRSLESWCYLCQDDCLSAVPGEAGQTSVVLTKCDMVCGGEASEIC